MRELRRELGGGEVETLKISTSMRKEADRSMRKEADRRRIGGVVLP
jgi:hypothetical protein